MLRPHLLFHTTPLKVGKSGFTTDGVGVPIRIRERYDLVIRAFQTPLGLHRFNLVETRQKSPMMSRKPKKRN